MPLAPVCGESLALQRLHTPTPRLCGWLPAPSRHLPLGCSPWLGASSSMERETSAHRLWSSSHAHLPPLPGLLEDSKVMRKS